MPTLPLLPLPKLKGLPRLRPPRPPSLEEVGRRAEDAFIRFNQGPCVDGKAHVFKTQPFPPYAREFCAKCGVDKDDLATFRDSLRTYHGQGDRLWTGAAAAVAARAPAAPAVPKTLPAPVVLAVGVALLIIGLGQVRPPLSHSGTGFFLAFLGLAISLISAVIWSADVGSRTNLPMRRYYGFSDSAPSVEHAPEPAVRPAAVPGLPPVLVLLGLLSLALFVAGVVLVWPPLRASGVGFFALFLGLALGLLLGVVWAGSGQRAKTGGGP